MYMGLPCNAIITINTNLSDNCPISIQPLCYRAVHLYTSLRPYTPLYQGHTCHWYTDTGTLIHSGHYHNAGQLNIYMTNMNIHVHGTNSEETDYFTLRFLALSNVIVRLLRIFIRT